jgi:hypothetical protein
MGQRSHPGRARTERQYWVVRTLEHGYPRRTIYERRQGAGTSVTLRVAADPATFTEQAARLTND